MWQESPSYDRNNGGYRDSDMLEMDDAQMADDQQPTGYPYGGIRQMEQTSASSTRERFAFRGTNPYTALHYINRELMEQGLPSPLLLPELPESLEDNQRIVECLSMLLEQRKRDMRFRESMDDELRKAMGEEDTLRSTISRLERDLNASEREQAMLRIKLQEAERQSAAAEAQKKKLANELRATKSNASMVKTQFSHDSKKREQEMIRLKERMQKLITDKHRNAKLVCELINPIARDYSNNSTEYANRDRRLLEELIGKYEENEAKLIAKVEDLESNLRQLVLSLSDLYRKATGNDVSLEQISESDIPQISHLAEMVNNIWIQVHSIKSQKVTFDSSEIEKRDEQISELKAEIAKQQKEVEDLTRILSEQKRVMEMVTSNGFKSGGLDQSMSEMSLEELEMERQALRREKDQLEEERKRFTEAAIELGNERNELKHEKDEFEKQKTMKSTADLIAGLPPTPQWMKGLDTSQATPMIMQHIQSMYTETPTNNTFANTSISRFSSEHGNSAAISPRTQTSRSGMEEFPELDRQSVNQKTVSRKTSTTSFTTPSIERGKAPARTPVEVRSSRQPRVCTRIGCAAHTPHEHNDGVVMELKPPVPRFHKK